MSPALLTLILANAWASSPALTHDQVLDQAASTTYGRPTDTPAQDPSDPVVAHWLEFYRQSPSTTLQQTLYDPRLESVAQALALRWQETGQLPAAPYLQAALWKAGVVAAPASIELLEVDRIRFFARNENILETLAPRLRGQGEHPRIGAAFVKISWRKYIEAAVVVEEYVQLDPVPKAHQPGQQLTLAGQLAAPAGSASLYVDGVDGRVEQVPVAVEPDGHFRVDVTLPTPPGSYYAELLVRSDLRSVDYQSLALLPFHVGAGEPGLLALLPSDGTSAGQDPAAWPAWILDLYDRERQRLGLTPLTFEPWLQDQASQWATHLGTTNQQALEPGFGQKLTREGHPFHDALQSVWMVDDAATSATLNLRSPFHRAYILSTRPTQVGIGVEKKHLPDGGPGYIVVEHLLQPVGKLDSTAESQRLYELVDNRRQQAGLPAMQQEPLASTLVAEFGQAVCAGQQDPHDVAPLTASFRDADYAVTFGGGYQLQPLMLEDNYIDEALLLSFGDDLLDPQYTHLASTSCQGALPDRPGGQYAILLLLGPYSGTR